MKLRLVIVGTDTSVGKTIFASALVHALNAYYWKPIQSGMYEETDSKTIHRIGRIPKSHIIPEKWKLRTPASPHLAAEIDGVIIDPATINPPDINDSIIIEGIGGLLVPLTTEYLFIDLIERWQFPIILCARTSLGTINHSLLSLETLRNRNINIIGIAFIGDSMPKVEETIVKIGRIPHLGRLPKIDPIDPDVLHQKFQEHFTQSLLQKYFYESLTF
ncbi:dethiobiotin synthase [Candidatus Liberibacter asiaticus]|uniref:ATP-dependent dethiobiotin synthetase BioD n=2 Tax=Liberibacter asiaticus TaxID=34021 RepID=C6XF08_LIBAP|nr:dethiobiotin synthase [Candidatus Liberibacter asiaticus]ACT56960.1 dithiobiotin synthetase [Candidatus Liberibacter asiaticus str. psy62]AGH16725.1 dithiobiotin synthetase [Candidatus Liberibacter asiaticus str. gxpsy]ALK07100.1 ATP-dependent dethiobiotin synthetase BioD [Candidatus Liberibacter asiaticus]ASK52574.1 dethiobiotin synthase [Candidatus Liberibacter asiaticus]AWL13900.1 ATP-dependent dethiobiotin synthetase BioD [Candidatus Liberibacter asiaticus]